ncbi:hypothetical protein AB6C98_12255 [Vibrio splendidus]
MKHPYILPLLAYCFLTPMKVDASPTERGMKLKTINLENWNLITRTDYEYDSFDNKTNRTSFTVWLKPYDESAAPFTVDFMCGEFNNSIGLYARDSFFFSISNGATIDFKNEKGQIYSFSVEKSLNRTYRNSIFVPDEDKQPLLEIFKDSTKGYFRFHGQSGINVAEVDFHDLSTSYDSYYEQCSNLSQKPESFNGKIDGVCPNGCDRYYN